MLCYVQFFLNVIWNFTSKQAVADVTEPKYPFLLHQFMLRGVKQKEFAPA